MGSMKLAATIALFLFSSSLVHARDPLNLQENEPTVHTELPDSNGKVVPSILLPGEKAGYESESNRVLDFEPVKENEIDLSKLPETEMEMIEPRNEEKHEEEETDKKMPLTVVTFRPIHHHFLRGSLIPLRRGRRCGHHHQFKRFGHGFHVPEISFGNDMILSKEVDTRSNPVGDDESQIPTHWSSFHMDHQPRLPPFDHEMEKREDVMMPRHHQHHHHHHGEGEFEHEMENREDMMMPHHHHHHRHHHGEEEIEFEHEHGHEHEKGLMRKIRKFLVNFQA